ncbi:MAG: hypothetical protein H7338_24815 [Candidatus Sericytochromatia bacterium]|nr:hypothetical protein [Candidatus Sericytochromatia bacterium]
MSTEDEALHTDYMARRNATAAARAQSRAAGEVPSHGVFYFVDGVIYAHPESIKSGVKADDIMSSVFDHFTFWHQLSRSIPALIPAHADLQNYYPAFPRGRVIYNWRTDTFKVSLSPEIPEETYPEITAKFGLQKYQSTLQFDVTETLYARSNDDIDALGYLLATHGIANISGRETSARRGDDDCKKVLDAALLRLKKEAARRSATSAQASLIRLAPGELVHPSAITSEKETETP